MSTITIQPVVPANLIIPPLTSSSKNILRARYETVTPITSASDYQYNGNSRLEFLINSASDFVAFNESFVRFNLTCDLEVPASTDDTDRWLGSGAANSIFREIRVETSSGVVLQRLDRYNKWYAMLSIGMPGDYVESALFASGDSLQAGADYINTPGQAANQPTREFVAQTLQDGITITLQPQIPLLMGGGSLFPVSLVKGGIRIIFELEDPALVLGSSTATDQTAAGGFTAANVKISAPRYITKFIQPSQQIMSAYIQQYNGDGLSYSFKDYIHSLNQIQAGANGTNVFQQYVSVRSATAIYTVLQNENAEVVSAGDAANNLNTYEFDSIGTFQKMNLSSYQYYSGSLRFPTQSNVNMTTLLNAEALQYYLEAQGKMGSSFYSLKCAPQEWAERQTVSGNTDSSKLVLASKLGRGDDFYSGLDLSLQPISIELTFDAVYAINAANKVRYAHSWTEHDSTLTISSSGILIRK